jgi:hypothetical protein
MNQAHGYTWLVTFSHPLDGGNVPLMFVPAACAPGASLPLGAGSPGGPPAPALPCTNMTSNSPADLAQNAVVVATVREGNQVDGTFTLSLGGATTGPMSFDIDPDLLGEKLAALPTVGAVAVTRDYPAGSGVTSEANNAQRVYAWHVTFLSNAFAGDADADWPSGFSQAWGVNVGAANPQLVCNAGALVDSAPGLTTVTCATAVERAGTDPVNGFFRLCLDTTAGGGGRANGGSSYVAAAACTANLRHDAAAMRADHAAAPNATVQAALEALPNVGSVAVARARTTAAPNFAGDYTWTITFLTDGDSAACSHRIGDVVGSSCRRRRDLVLGLWCFAACGGHNGLVNKRCGRFHIEVVV